MSMNDLNLSDADTDALHAMAVQGVQAAMILAGEDPYREGVEETPARWVKALGEMCVGYKTDASLTLNTTFDVAADEMVVVHGVPFVSLCEHHLLPFTGTATIGYLPGERIVGLSKLPRLLHAYAKRPQVQERLTSQVSETMQAVLQPRGCGVIIEGHHTCMSCRGVQSAGQMVTSSLLGSFREDAQQRAEFLSYR
jgi:GTP cyclohydrolase I